ncbi:MAG: ATP phosphoribosyltransferase [Micavibrio aeruginosavorus]|uniref:ATP phosphoribosyltransferase n=1 Tax=Micavibrio aeruginosavorus TaxID=349221 RepID=A0A7T5R2K6_9BACT|nr:MAG: ATP phosphoribosyltransferase [Micavibrio aeruginosavorus]
MAVTPDACDGQPFRIILPEQKRLRRAFDGVAAAAGLDFEKPSPRASLGYLVDKKREIESLVACELRADAALDWLADGTASLAIVGADMLAEYQAINPRASLKPVLTLERICCCSLWIAAKPEINIRNINDLEGMRLASAYPALLQQLLQQNGTQPASILPQKGNVEATLAVNRADAILEVVETGASLKANGLEKKLKVFNSCAVLVRSHTPFSAANESLTQKLGDRLKGAQETCQPPQQPDIILF